MGWWSGKGSKVLFYLLGRRKRQQGKIWKPLKVVQEQGLQQLFCQAEVWRDPSSIWDTRSIFQWSNWKTQICFLHPLVRWGQVPHQGFWFPPTEREEFGGRILHPWICWTCFLGSTCFTSILPTVLSVVCYNPFILLLCKLYLWEKGVFFWGFICP